MMLLSLSIYIINIKHGSHDSSQIYTTLAVLSIIISFTLLAFLGLLIILGLQKYLGLLTHRVLNSTTANNLTTSTKQIKLLIWFFPNKSEAESHSGKTVFCLSGDDYA